MESLPFPAVLRRDADLVESIARHRAGGPGEDTLAARLEAVASRLRAAADGLDPRLVEPSTAEEPPTPGYLEDRPVADVVVYSGLPAIGDGPDGKPVPNGIVPAAVAVNGRYLPAVTKARLRIIGEDSRTSFGRAVLDVSFSPTSLEFRFPTDEEFAEKRERDADLVARIQAFGDDEDDAPVVGDVPPGGGAYL